MKIAVFQVEPWEREAFERLGDEHKVVLTGGPLTRENAEEFADAQVISAFIYSELSEEVLERFENLELIATRSTGFDHVATGYCERNGITVSNVPSYGQNTVAEHVFGLLLALAHHLIEAVDRTRRGDFSLQGLAGFDLRGKTLGVIGTGDIGRCEIEIAKGFRMEVVAFDVQEKRELASQLGFEYAPMEEVLYRADFLTLHVPLNEQTRHLISGEQFEKMKDGVVLINTSRGAVVDVQALLRALADGKVAAAGLDVLPEEPTVREEAELLRSVFREQQNLEVLLADHVLLRMRNVIITPHSAFYTREAVGRILDVTVENIVSFARGEPQNVVAGGAKG